MGTIVTPQSWVQFSRHHHGYNCHTTFLGTIVTPQLWVQFHNPNHIIMPINKSFINHPLNLPFYTWYNGMSFTFSVSFDFPEARWSILFGQLILWIEDGRKHLHKLPLILFYGTVYNFCHYSYLGTNSHPNSAISNYLPGQLYNNNRTKVHCLEIK